MMNETDRKSDPDRDRHCLSYRYYTIHLANTLWSYSTLSYDPGEAFLATLTDRFVAHLQVRTDRTFFCSSLLSLSSFSLRSEKTRKMPEEATK